MAIWSTPNKGRNPFGAELDKPRTPNPAASPASPLMQTQAAPPTMQTKTNMGTPNTPPAPVDNSWQRGDRGMARVKTPGVKSYAPQPPPVTSGIGYMTDPASRAPAQTTTGMNPASPFAPGGRMDPLKQSGATPPQTGPQPTGDTSTWTPADWARYNTANQPAALKQPMWNGKPVQTGAYQPPSWKQPVAAPPPPAAVAPPLPATTPPPTTTPGTTGGISPAVQAEIDRVRGFLGPQWTPDEAWIQNVTAGLAQQNPLATALGNYNPGG